MAASVVVNGRVDVHGARVAAVVIVSPGFTVIVKVCDVVAPTESVAVTVKV